MFGATSLSPESAARSLTVAWAQLGHMPSSIEWRMKIYRGMIPHTFFFLADSYYRAAKAHRENFVKSLQTTHDLLAPEAPLTRHVMSCLRVIIDRDTAHVADALKPLLMDIGVFTQRLDACDDAAERLDKYRDRLLVIVNGGRDNRTIDADSLQRSSLSSCSPTNQHQAAVVGGRRRSSRDSPGVVPPPQHSRHYHHHHQPSSSDLCATTASQTPQSQSVPSVVRRSSVGRAAEKAANRASPLSRRAPSPCTITGRVTSSSQAENDQIRLRLDSVSSSSAATINSANLNDPIPPTSSLPLPKPTASFLSHASFSRSCSLNSSSSTPPPQPLTTTITDLSPLTRIDINGVSSSASSTSHALTAAAVTVFTQTPSRERNNKDATKRVRIERKSSSAVKPRKRRKSSSRRGGERRTGGGRRVISRRRGGQQSRKTTKRRRKSSSSSSPSTSEYDSDDTTVSASSGGNVVTLRKQPPRQANEVIVKKENIVVDDNTDRVKDVKIRVKSEMAPDDVKVKRARGRPRIYPVGMSPSDVVKRLSGGTRRFLPGASSTSLSAAAVVVQKARRTGRGRTRKTGFSRRPKTTAARGLLRRNRQRPSFDDGDDDVESGSDDYLNLSGVVAPPSVQYGGDENSKALVAVSDSRMLCGDDFSMALPPKSPVIVYPEQEPILQEDAYYKDSVRILFGDSVERIEVSPNYSRQVALVTTGSSTSAQQQPDMDAYFTPFEVLKVTQELEHAYGQPNGLDDFFTMLYRYTCHQGVQLIRSMLERCCGGAGDVLLRCCESTVDALLMRDLLLPSSYCCTRELMSLWCRVQRQVQGADPLGIGKAALRLCLPAASLSAHFYLFADVLWEMCGSHIFPHLLELIIRGINIDLNALENLRAAHSPKADRIVEMECHLATVYTKLASLFMDYPIVRRECLLSAFVMEPTKQRLDILEDLSKCRCSNDDSTTNDCCCPEAIKKHPEPLPEVVRDGRPRYFKQPAFHPILSQAFSGVSYQLLQYLTVVLEAVRPASVNILTDWSSYLRDFAKSKRGITHEVVSVGTPVQSNGVSSKEVASVKNKSNGVSATPVGDNLSDCSVDSAPDSASIGSGEFNARLLRRQREALDTQKQRQKQQLEEEAVVTADGRVVCRLGRKAGACHKRRKRARVAPTSKNAHAAAHHHHHRHRDDDDEGNDDDDGRSAAPSTSSSASVMVTSNKRRKSGGGAAIASSNNATCSATAAPPLFSTSASIAPAHQPNFRAILNRFDDLSGTKQQTLASNSKARLLVNNMTKLPNVLIRTPKRPPHPRKVPLPPPTARPTRLAGPEFPPDPTRGKISEELLRRLKEEVDNRCDKSAHTQFMKFQTKKPIFSHKKEVPCKYTVRTITPRVPVQQSTAAKATPGQISTSPALNKSAVTVKSEPLSSTASPVAATLARSTPVKTVVANVPQKPPSKPMAAKAAPIAKPPTPISQMSPLSTPVSPAPSPVLIPSATPPPPIQSPGLVNAQVAQTVKFVTAASSPQSVQTIQIPAVGQPSTVALETKAPAMQQTKQMFNIIQTSGGQKFTIPLTATVKTSTNDPQLQAKLVQSAVQSVLNNQNAMRQLTGVAASGQSVQLRINATPSATAVLQTGPATTPTSVVTPVSQSVGVASSTTTSQTIQIQTSTGHFLATTPQGSNVSTVTIPASSLAGAQGRIVAGKIMIPVNSLLQQGATLATSVNGMPVIILKNQGGSAATLMNKMIGATTLTTSPMSVVTTTVSAGSTSSVIAPAAVSTPPQPQQPAVVASSSGGAAGDANGAKKMWVPVKIRPGMMEYRKTAPAIIAGSQQAKANNEKIVQTSAVAGSAGTTRLAAVRGMPPGMVLSQQLLVKTSNGQSTLMAVPSNLLQAVQGGTTKIITYQPALSGSGEAAKVIAAEVAHTPAPSMAQQQQTSTTAKTPAGTNALTGKTSSGTVSTTAASNQQQQHDSSTASSNGATEGAAVNAQEVISAEKRATPPNASVPLDEDALTEQLIALEFGPITGQSMELQPTDVPTNELPPPVSPPVTTPKKVTLSPKQHIRARRTPSNHSAALRTMTDALKFSLLSAASEDSCDDIDAEATISEYQELAQSIGGYSTDSSDDSIQDLLKESARLRQQRHEADFRGALTELNLRQHNAEMAAAEANQLAAATTTTVVVSSSAGGQQSGTTVTAVATPVLTAALLSAPTQPTFNGIPLDNVILNGIVTTGIATAMENNGVGGALLSSGGRDTPKSVVSEDDAVSVKTTSTTGTTHTAASSTGTATSTPNQKRKGPYSTNPRDPANEALSRYKCAHCNRGFFSAYNLRRHHRNVHKMNIPIMTPASKQQQQQAAAAAAAAAATANNTSNSSSTTTPGSTTVIMAASNPTALKRIETTAASSILIKEEPGNDALTNKKSVLAERLLAPPPGSPPELKLNPDSILESLEVAKMSTWESSGGSNGLEEDTSALGSANNAGIIKMEAVGGS